MAFETFRQRCAAQLAGFNFTDEEITAAVRVVKAKGLTPHDNTMLAALKLRRLGQLINGKDKT